MVENTGVQTIRGGRQYLGRVKRDVARLKCSRGSQSCSGRTEHDLDRPAFRSWNHARLGNVNG